MNSQKLFLLFLLFLGNWAMAQTDDCMAAPELQVVADCLRSPGNTKGLRENAITNACGGNADDDGWFKFTAISERTQISVSTDQFDDMVIGLYQNCAVELACANNRGTGGQEILRYDTKIGEVYYIQIYEASDGGAEFLICVSALDPVICTPISANFDSTPPNCGNPFSGSIEINATAGGFGGYTYQINAEGFQSTPIFPNLAVGDYMISIKDSLDCQLDTLLTLADSISSNLNLTIGEDLVITQGELVELQAITNISLDQIASITWSGEGVEDCLQPCASILFTAIESTAIQATLTTIDGCLVTDELQLSVPIETSIYAPSAFSPNGDGINDFFTIYSNENIAIIQSLKIGDRWGNLVFQASDFPPNQDSFGWDGTFKNQRLSSQVFIYFLTVEMQDGSIKKLSGEIFLVL